MEFSNKYLKQLIIPLIFEQLLAVSVGFIDTLMVSTVGEVALSGVALVDNINRLVIQLLSAFATGGIVIVSQYQGSRDDFQARKCSGQLITLMISFSTLILLVFVLFTRPILGGIFGNVENDVMDSAATYMFITAFSYPGLAIYNSGAAIFRSFGNSKMSMKISILMNILNVGFNALFVFGMKMGVEGVGYATLISRTIAGIIMVIALKSDRNQLRIKSASEYKPSLGMAARILKIAIPSGLENSMFQIGKLVVVGMVADLGTTAIAANAVAYQIIDFPNLAASSIGLALITVVGQCMGAGDINATRQYTNKLIKAAYVCDWCSKGLLFVLAPFIVSIFSLSAEAADMSVLVLRAFAIASIIIWPRSFTLPNALRAAGDVKFTMIVSIASMWVCRIAVSYVLIYYFNLGVMGVWLGMFVDWYVRGILYTIRYLSKGWEGIKLI